MIQDKTPPADNGQPFSRVATPYWNIWQAPVGRADKRSPAVLRFLARASHSLRIAPSGQPLLGSLNPELSSGWSTSTRLRGFTLIEVMVAVLIVGLAVSALLVQIMSYTDSASYLREKTIAHWVALNQLELERIANRQTNRLLDKEKTGKTEMANREWFWRITPKKTGADGFIQLDIAVYFEEDDTNSLLTLTGYVDEFHRR